jgi:hypothetical protein
MRVQQENAAVEGYSTPPLKWRYTRLDKFGLSDIESKQPSFVDIVRLAKL